MPSHFSWIDFSEEDRQKMMDVVRPAPLVYVSTTRDPLAQPR
jgi:hypothetical protein